MKRYFLSVCIPCALASPAASFAAEIDFRRQVWPILEKNCVTCHRAAHKDTSGKMQNPKGGLRFDGASHILKGGSSGAAAEPGDPDKSGMYQRILLPPDNEDAMPPKGKGRPLTFNETEVIKNWILEGAKFGEWKGTDAAAPVVVKPTGAGSKADPLAAGVTMAPAEAMQKISSLGAIIGPVTPESKLLRVEWVSAASSITDKEVANLKPLGPNITELDLSDTKITDESMKLIGGFSRLTKLNVSGTGITDSGLAQLKGLTNLDYLNVHSTSVTGTGAQSLTTLRKLKHVYFWKTRVSASDAASLQKAIPGSTIVVN